MSKSKTRPFATALAKKKLFPGHPWMLLSAMKLNSLAILQGLRALVYHKLPLAADVKV